MPVLPPRLRAEHGFTMIIALGVMFVSSLLLVAAFTAVNGDINNSHENVTKQQAYYAALAGVQEYEYKLEANSSYWENCEPLSSTLESGERFEVTLLPAEGQAKCNPANPFETEIESSGAAANTFRVKSVGCAGATGLSTCSGQSKSSVSTRSIVATFKVTGFLDYVYFTQYEDLDPTLNGTNATNCTKYYEEKGVKRASECTTITFAKEDSVTGADAHRRCGFDHLQQRTDLRARKTETARRRRNQRRHLSVVQRRVRTNVQHRIQNVQQRRRTGGARNRRKPRTIRGIRQHIRRSNASHTPAQRESERNRGNGRKRQTR